MSDDALRDAIERIGKDRAMKSIQRIVDAKSGFFRDAFVALSFNGISGDYAEFGSFGGTTLYLAYEEIKQNSAARKMWAFDSFSGLPETDDPRDEHPAWIAGSMAMSVENFRSALDERGVPRGAYTTVEGHYDETLPKLGVDGAPVDIALAYVDCDMYSSTASVLEFLAPRLKHGMIVAFDDYYCWTPTDVSGERAALDEFLAANPQWNFHRYRDIGWGGASFVVEDARRRPSGPLPQAAGAESSRRPMGH